MTVIITTELTPYSITRSMKEGRATLHIDIKNGTNEDKLVSVEVRTGRGLSITKGGLVREKAQELGVLKARGAVDFYTELYPTYNAAPGYDSVTIIVKEHYKDYQHILKTYNKEMAVRID
ncbi:MAG: hypothetical protein JXA43_01855 [Candidatus Diapherotrites archaeon]|nr:hypothetical protein [Candidatus Diapherotrites archaeon]